MAFTFGFYNSLNGDRKYNSIQVSEIIDCLINDGVLSTRGEIFGTTPGDGMQVLVGTGFGWFNHTWNKNDSKFPININKADVTLSRYDTVILEVNSEVSARSNRLRVLTGQAATTPQKPLLTNTETIHQHPLAHVLVRPASESITQSDIQVVVGTSVCPFAIGVLEGVNIDVLFQQWEGDFMAWWDNIKATLDENVVTNLQNQIDARVKISDLANEQDVYDGTSNTKWMSPAKTKKMTENMIINFTESKPQIIRVADIFTTETKSTINIPFNRPLSDFYELNILVSGMVNNGLTARLNNISATSYIHSSTTGNTTNAGTVVMTNMITAANGGNVSSILSDKSKVLSIKLKPSKIEDFIHRFVYYEIHYNSLLNNNTTGRADIYGYYDSSLGGVNPEHMEYLTLGENFNAGMQISVWGILREKGVPIDIPIVEMPYIQEWTEFIKDPSILVISTEAYNAGVAAGRFKQFTSPGTMDFVKNRLYKLIAVGSGGGGRGAGWYTGGPSGYSLTGYTGSAGAPGQVKTINLVLPVDLPNVSITVPAGGAGGAGTGSSFGGQAANGSPGSASSIGSFLSALGGGSGGSTNYGSPLYVPATQADRTLSQTGEIGVVPFSFPGTGGYGKGGNGGNLSHSMKWQVDGSGDGYWFSSYSATNGNLGGSGACIIMW